MNLQLYGFGQAFKSDPFAWDAFISGFAPMSVIQDPTNSKAGHWRFEHPTHPIHFYAAVTGLLTKRIGEVHFTMEDVTRVGHEEEWLAHPLWAGLFNALTSWPAILVAKVHAGASEVAKAVVIAGPELETRLPNWARSSQFQMFIVPTRQDFDRLMDEAWNLRFDVEAADQPRLGWADEIDQHEKARAAFASYITSESENAATFSWGGRLIEPLGLRTGFLEQYCDWVDWREFDDQIVELFGTRLMRPRLEAKMVGEDLLISFGTERKRRLTRQEIGKEQYQTIRAMNEVLAPDFEVRVVRKEADGDTHGLLLAPGWLWKHLEDLDRAKLERKISAINRRDGFRSGS